MYTYTELFYSNKCALETKLRINELNRLPVEHFDTRLKEI